MTQAGRRLEDTELGPALTRLRRSARLTRNLVFAASALGAVVLAMPVLFMPQAGFLPSAQTGLPINWGAFFALCFMLAPLMVLFARLVIRRHGRRMAEALEGSDLLARVLGGWLESEPLYEAAPALFKPGVKLAQSRNKGLAGELILMATRLDWYLKYPNGGNPFKFELAAICSMVASMLILPLIGMLMNTVLVASLGGSTERLMLFLGLSIVGMSLVCGLPLIPLMYQNMLSSAALDALDDYLSSVISSRE
ncbi:hypothetical protein IT575_02525 [bacterium]|nr:hypothetical protein [bacterium]